MVVFELTGRYIKGLYVILLGTSYAMFLTFCIVIDSCHTKEDKKKCYGSFLINKVFRIFMHTVCIGLLLAVFFIPGCNKKIYPKGFIAVMFVILIHQVYDLFLYNKQYLINFERLPTASRNKLQYN